MLGLWLLLALLLSGCGDGSSSDLTAVPPAGPPVLVQPEPEPAPSTTLRWRMTGAFADGRMLRWTFTYDHDALPTAVNVRGLEPNAVYAMRDVEIQVEAGGTHAQPALDLSAVPTEFCLGECIFSPELGLRLYASTPQHQLQIVLLTPAPPQGLPRTGLEWGALNLNASWLTSYTETGTLIARVMLRSLTIEAIDVPEPAATPP